MQNQAMNLPVECWEMIFNKVGHHDHFDAISLVCKRFLSISSCLIHSLTISDPRILIHCNFPKLFQRFRQIKRIHVSSPFEEGFQELDALMAEISRSGLNIEELRLSDLYTIPVKCYQEICSSMKDLKTLTCKNSNLRDSSLVVIGNSLTKLQELKTCDRAALTDTGIEEMASKLKGLRKISLTISGRDAVPSRSVTDKGISDALRHCSNLTSLSVTYNEVSFLRSPATIEKSVSFTRALCALEFRDSVISDAFLASIVEANLPLKKLRFHQCKNITVSGLSILLRKYQSLSEFKFAWSMYLTDKDMDHLSKYLGHVTRVNLSGCENLTNSTFFLLTRSCPLLVDIKMCCTGLGKDGDLRVDLKQHSQVQFLDLSGCKYLNDESLKKIGYICPNLQTLALCNHPDVTEQGISEVLKSCPGIRHFKFTESKLETILGTTSEHSKLNIEVLQAGLTGINDEGMAMIGRRCPHLLRLILTLCSEVTADGVKEVMEKCPKLMEIDLRESYNIDADELAGMLLTRPSLRKVLSPDESFPTEERRNLFMQHGCRLY